MFRRLIRWWGETNLIGQVFLVGSLGSYGDGGALLGPLFRFNVWKFFVCSSPILKPKAGGLDIVTYRDQWSIFLGFEFRKSVFLGYWSELLYFLEVVKQMLYF